MKPYQIIKFQDGDFSINIQVSPDEQTLWLTQDQIAELFGKARSTITEHINNIFSDGELAELTSVGNSDRSIHKPIGRKLRNYSACKKCTNSIPNEGTN